VDIALVATVIHGSFVDSRAGSFPASLQLLAIFAERLMSAANG